MTTRAYNYTGDKQYFKVPPGVGSITITAVGAAGGGTAGGYPGLVTGTLNVFVGEFFVINIGSVGTAGVINAAGAGGYNGGGNGGATLGTTNLAGSGGGGSSDVSYANFPGDERIFVGAGGGGMGAQAGGNGGGTTGQAGVTGGTSGGGAGGSQVAGGAHGTGTSGGNGTDGALYNGGVGGTITGTNARGGGGGGGGEYGGGGGYSALGAGLGGGGGGGSNFLTGAATSTTNTQGYTANGRINGYVLISYVRLPTVTAWYPAFRSRVLRQTTYAFKWIFAKGDGSTHTSSDFRYTLRTQPDQWTTLTAVNTTSVVNGAILSYTLTATLTDNAEYYWAVRVTDSSGAVSAWSDTYVFTPSSTPAANPQPLSSGISLDVYNGVSKNFISSVPGALDMTYLEEFGPGSGSFTIPFNDPNLLANPSLIDYRNVVRVRINSYYVGFWVVTKIEPTWITSDEYSGAAITVSGLGGRGAWLSDAVVYPDAAAFSTPALALVNDGGPQPDQRVFGYTSASYDGNWYDPTLWQPAVNQSLQSSTATWAPSTATGNPWKPGPANWIADGNACWISYTNTRGLTGDYNGNIYYRFDFSTAIDQNIQAFFAGDNQFVAYLDGQQIATSVDWTQTTASEIIQLAAGPHCLAVEVVQVGWTVANQLDPTALLAAVYTVGDATAGTVATLLFDTANTGRWGVVGHPGIAPGWTVGDIIQQLYTEAFYRSVTSFNRFITLSFDDNADSYGLIWPTASQWSFDIGTGYDTVVDSLESVECDVWIDWNFQLQSAPVRGLDRSAVYPGDTYDALIARDMPYFYYPLSTSPGSVTGGTGWNSGLFQLLATHTGATDNTYAQAMTTPAQLTGMKFSINTGGAFQERANVPLGAAWTYEWWASVPVNNSLGWFANMTYPSLFVSVDIQDAKDITGASIAGLQQAYFSFNDTDNDSGGFAAAIANYPSDPTPAHYVLKYEDTGTSAGFKFYRNGSVLIDYPVNPGHTLSVVAPQMHNWGRNGGDTPTAASIVAGYAFYDRVLTDDQITNHYRAGLGAFNPVTQPVVFSPARNVKQADASLEFRVKSALVVKSAAKTYEVGVTSSTRSRWGRIEGYYDGSSLSESDTRSVASATIANLSTSTASARLDIYDDYTPWYDFQVGDWVLAPPDFVTRRNLLNTTDQVFGSATVGNWTVGANSGTAPTISAAVSPVPLMSARSLQILFATQTAGNSYALVSSNQNVRTIAGKVYIFTAYVYTTNGTKAHLTAGGVDGTPSTGTNGVWERISVVFAATSSQTAIYVENHAATTSGSATVYVDGVLVEEYQGAVLPHFDYLTYGSVTLGDGTVTFSSIVPITSPVYRLTKRRIASISVALDADTRRPIYTVEVDTIDQINDARLSKWLQRVTPEGSLNGVIPNVIGRSTG